MCLVTLNHNQLRTKSTQRRVSSMTAPLLSFLRHLLLATIADKILSSVDLWSRPVQSLPFVLTAKHFH